MRETLALEPFSFFFREEPNDPPIPYNESIMDQVERHVVDTIESEGVNRVEIGS